MAREITLTEELRIASNHIPGAVNSKIEAELSEKSSMCELLKT
jgi:hypothetical protein